jgi:hypothetical protein
LRNPGSKRTATCAASTSNDRQSIALLRDRSQLLPSARTFLARNQSQITRHLFASRKTSYIADRQHIRQRRIRTDARLRHQQPRLRMLLGRLLYRLVQLPDLPVQHPEQSE